MNETKAGVMPGRTNYDKMYGSVDAAANTIAMKMYAAALDASPYPSGPMESLAEEYVDRQVALADKVFGPMVEWAREMLESDAGRV